MKRVHPQLPLNLGVREEFSFENFVTENNGAVIQSLIQQLSPEGEPYIYLWGKPGSGCSHLLQAACQRASEQGGTSIYLPMDQLIDLDAGLLEGVETVDLVCLDHIDSIVGNDAWEEGVFHLFNRIKDQQGYLLVAANNSAQASAIQLADLKSRLASGVIYKVQSLEDEGKLDLLKQRAKNKGLLLSSDSAQFILNRAERDVEGLLDMLEQLDKNSLSHGRKLTIPFIKAVMDW